MITKVNSHLFILITLLFLLTTLTTSTLLWTPSNDTTMKVYGSIVPAVDPDDGEKATISWSHLKSITITSPTSTAELINFQYVKLALFSLPDGIEIPLEKSSANFDKDGGLQWDLAVALPVNNTGVLIDMDINWTKIGPTDDKEITSDISFVFTKASQGRGGDDDEEQVSFKNKKKSSSKKNHKKDNDDDEEETFQQTIPFHHLTYDEQEFDIRYETFITQDSQTPNTNTYYRWSALLYDTTKWKAKSIEIYFVGPLTFTTKPNSTTTLSNNQESTILPQLQPLQTQSYGKDVVVCYMNSLEQAAEINYETGILTFTFTNDFDVTIPYRGALSITCPDLFIVQKYPLTTSFLGATKSIAVISIWDKIDPKIKDLLDIRSQNVHLFEYVNFPTAIRGQGWVENNKVMATYSIKYPHGNDIYPQDLDQLRFEWAKITLQHAIHSYALPIEIYNTTSPWATQQYNKIDDKKLKDKFNIIYKLKDIFNAEDLTVQDFIVQQYANVAEKSPSIDAVNVFRYTMQAAEMPPAPIHLIASSKHHKSTKLDTLSTGSQDKKGNKDKKDKKGLYDELTMVIDGLDSNIVNEYLTTIGPQVLYQQQQQQRNAVVSKPLTQQDQEDDKEIVLPQLKLKSLSPSQQFDLVQFSSKKPQKFSVALGTVPQLKRLQAISETVSFEDQKNQFNYAINDALVIFDTVQFTFPRGATYFRGDFTSCSVTISSPTSTIMVSGTEGDITTVDTFAIAPKDINGHSKGDLEELIFAMGALNRTVQIGQSITFNCLHGGVTYRHKQPVLSNEYLTVQASLSGDGMNTNDDNNNSSNNNNNNTSNKDDTKSKTSSLYNSPDIIDSKITPTMINTNVHAVHSLLGLQGTTVTQTTISFMPHSYYFSISAMIIGVLVFLSLCTLAIFIMPLLACIGVIHLDDHHALTPSSPYHNSINGTSQHNKGSYSMPIIAPMTRRGSSSSSMGFQSTTSSASVGEATPGAYSIGSTMTIAPTTKTTQYGTISTEMDDGQQQGVSYNSNGEKQLKSILKRKA